jgi:hypothetical protein
MKINIEFKMAILSSPLRTQRNLSRKTGIHESLISLAVHGRYNLDPVQRAKICLALGRAETEIFLVRQ